MRQVKRISGIALALTLLGGAVPLAAQEPPQADPAEGGQSIAEVLGVDADPQSDRFDHIEQRIARDEATSAARELGVIIDQIEAVYHQSHPDLVRPLTLLGDAQAAEGEFDEALETYGRAVYISRVNNGLFHPDQLEIVYREADTYARAGDLQEARNREEYAYEIMKRGFDSYDPEAIPGLERLARFYLRTYNYLAARVFFKKALGVHSANGTELTRAAIPILRGIAQTYRLERFPPFYLATTDDTRASGPTPGLDDAELARQHISINNFPEGERALQQVVEIAQTQAPADPELVSASILDLADWHLLWDRSNEANTLYGYIYNQMLAAGDNPTEMFGEPTLIYLPRPRPPRPPPPGRRLAEEQGVVTLQFEITTSGRIRKLKTVHSHPPDMMDFQVRRSMRLAVFRPHLLDGVPQTVEDYTYSYEFPYFPSVRVATPEQEGGSDGASRSNASPEKANADAFES